MGTETPCVDSPIIRVTHIAQCCRALPLRSAKTFADPPEAVLNNPSISVIDLTTRAYKRYRSRSLKSQNHSLILSGRNWFWPKRGHGCLPNFVDKVPAKTREVHLHRTTSILPSSCWFKHLCNTYFNKDVIDVSQQRDRFQSQAIRTTRSQLPQQVRVAPCPSAHSFRLLFLCGTVRSILTWHGRMNGLHQVVGSGTP